MIRLLLTLIFTACLTLAAVLDPTMRELHRKTNTPGGILGALLGDSRRMFGNEFFAMADDYFHSGFYPTIFDSAKSDEDVNGKPEPGGEKEEKGENFMGRPKDWIEKFGRNFIPTVHSHLGGGNQREILPWLRLSADVDPQRIQTYLTASYWLRTSLGKPAEAEQFLREGMRANPESHELLTELGYIYDDNKKDPAAARRLWELALQKWSKAAAAGLQPNPKDRVEILDGLVRADKQLKDPNQLLADLQALKPLSPNPSAIEQTIQETRAALAAPPQSDAK